MKYSFTAPDGTVQTIDNGVPDKTAGAATMKISELVAELSRLQALHGDVPVALWDLEWWGYFRLTSANLEVQRMADGSCRLSIGVNDWHDAREPEPAERPIA